jgi:hypothetical protein
MNGPRKEETPDALAGARGLSQTQSRPECATLCAADAALGVVYWGTTEQIRASGLIREESIPKGPPGDYGEPGEDCFVLCHKLEDGTLLLTMSAAESCRRDHGFRAFRAGLLAPIAFWSAVYRGERAQHDDGGLE